jgi:hypothetical protein
MVYRNCALFAPIGPMAQQPRYDPLPKRLRDDVFPCQVTGLEQSQGTIEKPTSGIRFHIGFVPRGYVSDVSRRLTRDPFPRRHIQQRPDHPLAEDAEAPIDLAFAAT